MILRRVIHHFRNQEWTAIGIDFVIVVFGVFFGIQYKAGASQRATYDELISTGNIGLIEDRELLNLAVPCCKALKQKMASR